MELDVYHIACLFCQVIHIVRDLDVRQNSVADVAWATRESLRLENVCSAPKRVVPEATNNYSVEYVIRAGLSFV